MIRTRRGKLKRGKHGRWLRLPGSLVVALILAASVTACSQSQQLSGTCGVVVDGSLSGNAVHGFDAQAQLKAHLQDFLVSKGCRYVVFAPINHASEASVCSESMIDMDPPVSGNVDVQSVITAGRAAAQNSAQKELTCASSDPRSIPAGSDIIGGLARIDAELRQVKGPYNVLVVSDFINWDSDLRLTKAGLATNADRTSMLSRLARQGLIPNLGGVNIDAAGFGILVSKSPQVYPEFADFWQQFMQQAHAASFKTNVP
jgi:hypothetical protein